MDVELFEMISDLEQQNLDLIKNLQDKMAQKEFEIYKLLNILNDRVCKLEERIQKLKDQISKQ
jgi:hypothetical protein